jgi:hypothetical protein
LSFLGCSYLLDSFGAGYQKTGGSSLQRVRW